MATPIPVAIPGGESGIGFDDLAFAQALRKVLVPGGRTGSIFLINPSNMAISSLGGFSSEADYKGGHGEGVTSADEGGGLIFGGDRNTETLHAIDAFTGKAVAAAKLTGHPDYVRYVSATRELWVTEPNSAQIEIFALGSDPKIPVLTRTGAIDITDGPESLVIDSSRSRAYTNSWQGETFAVEIRTRKIAASWKNGCSGSRGIALDEKRGFLFVGCEEGKAVVLDAAHAGKVISSVKAGDGVDVIAYNPKLRHLYLPGADSATMAILDVSDSGKLGLVATVTTAKGAHCVAADDRSGIWVCDPDRGRLLLFHDAVAK